MEGQNQDVDPKIIGSSGNLHLSEEKLQELNDKGKITTNRWTFWKQGVNRVKGESNTKTICFLKVVRKR